MRRLGILLGVILFLAAASAGGQQTAPPKPNHLLTGKLVYVAPMPANLDRWIIEYLRQWRKYKVIGDPEGVDLVFQSNAPEKSTEYGVPEGIPQPRRERAERPPISITVVDWVTNDTLWHADLLDRKQKRGETEAVAGPHTKIFMHGLKPDQVALKIVTRFREYVNDLGKATGEKQ